MSDPGNGFENQAATVVFTEHGYSCAVCGRPYDGEDHSTLDLATLTRIIHENAIAHGWWEGERHPLEVLMLIVGEIAEAMEEYRNGHALTEVYFKDGKPEGFPVELADVVIRLLDYSGQLGIDMEQVIMLKHSYNLTRPWKHGGKTA